MKTKLTFVCFVAKSCCALLDVLLSETQGLHHVITDNFLSHQSIISDPEPTLF